MVVSSDDCAKDVADQHFSERNTCEIISKEEAKEYLVEATIIFKRLARKSAVAYTIRI